MAGLEEWVGWGGDGCCEDAEGVLLDELEEGFDGGFRMDGAEIHDVVELVNEINGDSRERYRKS